MSQYVFDIDRFPLKLDLGDQSVIIAFDIEDSARAHRVSVRVNGPDFRAVSPHGFANYPIPFFKRSVRIGMFLPELSQFLLADDTHAAGFSSRL
jgi:hypothetical protein